jgi:anti-sigma factor RsiW
VNGTTHQPGRSAICAQCVAQLQDYLDGNLERELSLRFFLHLRECSACQGELEELKRVVQRLESLPEVPVPADFDARILSSIPYAAYRAMEPIRRERVPVFLEETFLPAAVRSPVVRMAGLAAAAVAGAGLAAGRLPDWSAAVCALGLVPELLVRLQRLARRARLAQERSGGG